MRKLSGGPRAIFEDTLVVALVRRLRAIAKEYSRDNERAHLMADDALLEFIGDARVRKAYNLVKAWHA